MFWIVRLILSLALLIGLWIVGLNTLYVENETMLGARIARLLGIDFMGVECRCSKSQLE